MSTLEEDRLKLSADGIVELFEITLAGGAGTLYLKSNNTVTWQGHTWEGIAIQLTGYGNTSEEELSRPSLSIANPNGILSQYIINGHLEKSLVKRKRVLLEHITGNQNIFQQQSWYISRVTQINKTIASFELRNPIDGPNILCPARMFIPPEFPGVSLG